MKETMIKALENKGFKRWTKGNYDRLYANVENFGLEILDRYKSSGRISGARLNGKKISNGRASDILWDTKIYVDVNTGDLHVSRDACEDIVENVRTAIEAAEAEVEAAEAAETAPETVEAVEASDAAETAMSTTETPIATALTGTPEQIATAAKIIEKHVARERAYINKKLERAADTEAKNPEKAQNYRDIATRRAATLEWLLTHATSAQWWLTYSDPESPDPLFVYGDIIQTYKRHPDMIVTVLPPKWLRGMSDGH